MREISIYIANDGKVFLERGDCEAYEFEYSHTLIFEIEFYNEDGERMFIDEEKYFESIEKILFDTYKVVFHSEKELAQFRELDPWIGIPCAMTDYIHSPGSWVFVESRRYNYGDSESWIREGTKIAITEIEWDLDEDDDNLNLPTEIIIEEPTGQMCEAVGGYTDALDDYLSDTYGFCIYGYKADFV